MKRKISGIKRVAKRGLQPELHCHENQLKGVAVVAGFNLDMVQDCAFILITDGYVPVEDTYTLMEHKTTKRRGHFRKLTLVRTSRVSHGGPNNLP